MVEVARIDWEALSWEEYQELLKDWRGKDFADQHPDTDFENWGISREAYEAKVNELIDGYGLTPGTEDFSWCAQLMQLGIAFDEQRRQHEGEAP